MNNATGDAQIGGGLYAPTSDVTIERSLFEGNIAAFGAGIAFSNGPQLIIRDSTITSNSTSSGHGGGIWFEVDVFAKKLFGIDTAKFLMTGSTVSDNDGADGFGGWAERAVRAVASNYLDIRRTGYERRGFCESVSVLSHGCDFREWEAKTRRTGFLRR